MAATEITKQLAWLLGLATLAAAPATLRAQTFQTIPALSFTKAYAGANPLSQVVGVASTGANFGFTGSATTSSGGSWLTIDSLGCCSSTPYGMAVNANPDVTLAAGTYAGQIALNSSNGTLTIPVTLIIEASTATFFDDLPGGLAYSMITAGKAPPAQPVQIRNAGAGTLTWTASATTADGGAWLKLSAANGTAPSTLNVSITPGNLPGLGLTPGTFAGQVLLHTPGNTVTVPVIVTVGASVFNQVNPLNFTKVYAGANPVSQVITLSSTGTNFGFTAYAVSSTGGNWLTIDNPGCCSSTPYAMTANVNPDITLAAGNYNAEIIVKSTGSAEAVAIPVTLTIAASTASFFDDVAGALTYSVMTDGNPPPAQPLQIRNAGAGTLNWVASATTADGGTWLQLSATSGTAPSTLNVSVIPANLPGIGLTAGTFIGEVVLQTTGDRVTVPITVTVGAAVFQQVNPLNFTKIFAGGNPLSQLVPITSTGANFGFTAYTISSTGGSWLSIDNPGCCSSTPYIMTASVNPDVTLAEGTYSAEIIIKSSGFTSAIIVPVTLTIEPQTDVFFDAVPGGLTYSMVTNGNAPPAQPIQIRNAGSGTLTWTASASTADGGTWLKLSAASGTATSTLNVSVNPADLPGTGLTAGYFAGEVVLQTSGDRVTIPVTVTVGASVINQINPLNFTKVFGGGNPLPQVIEIASTAANNIGFTGYTVSSTGGNWLTIDSLGCCSSTPYALTATVNPDVTLAAGTYSAEIVLKSTGFTQALNVPVTLTIEPPTATFFDALPGDLTYSMVTAGAAPAAQPLQIRNAGAGALNWTASATTADGGKWLKLSASSGTAPSTLTVSVVPANFPGTGLIAGMFVGQIVLQTTGDRVTIPVTVTVGSPVFVQIPAITFTEMAGSANPLSQIITVASSGTNFGITGFAVTAAGGNWLTINNLGCCSSTPFVITATATPAVTLAAGVYTAEILLKSSGGGAMIIPVSLTLTSNTPAATPVFNPPGGVYSSAQSVTITDSTPDSAIYYTTDGSTPTTASPVYTAPIPVSATETIKAIATAAGYLKSAVGTAVYTLTAPMADTPVATETIAIAEGTPGATIYYTTDGSTPTTASKQYTGPLVLANSSVLKFIAVAPGFTASAVRTVTTKIQ